MNNFKLKKRLNADREPEGPHPVKMTLSPYADQAEEIGGLFRVAFEIEIMQGSRKVLPSGDVRYCFKLDNEKAVQLEQALTLAFFQPTEN